MYLLNISMFIYDNKFMQGIHVHLCVYNGTGYIIMHDIFTGDLEMRFFTDTSILREYIENYKPQVK
jgi:hypothetical protein